jgi:drug/metabolite transporter (DMT)-like permease
VVGPIDRPGGWFAGAAVGPITDGLVAADVRIPMLEGSRLRKLQALGVMCGFAAGAWLGAAEAPTKLVRAGVSPVLISLLMVVGVFLARWSVPALMRGTGQVFSDARQAPHLIAWAILAGCLWAVANTLTIFAIRDIGLSIAFPLWNTNSLLGILWGIVFFHELRGAGWRRWSGVLGGTLLVFAGAVMLAAASSAQAPTGHAFRGVVAAVAAGVLWGTMYIPYRKAYLTGMNPLSFVAFFTVGELGMMIALALRSAGGPEALGRELVEAKPLLFWLAAGGFIWVIGDIFQQYAAKYIGISRGIPLSNTNQLWGLMWGVLVFGELRGQGAPLYTLVIGGSMILAAGAAAIALSSASPEEHERWQAAAMRESRLYGTDVQYVRAGLEGRAPPTPRRSFLDWAMLLAATLVFGVFAAMARAPMVALDIHAAAALLTVVFIIMAVCGTALWRITRFS